MSDGAPGRVSGPAWRSWALLVAILGASWSLLACLECLLALSCTIFVDHGLILVDLGAILVDLGSILADLATLRIELSPTRELDFHVFAMLRERSLSAYAFRELANLKIVPEGSSEWLGRHSGWFRNPPARSLGALGPLLGRS